MTVEEEDEESKRITWAEFKALVESLGVRDDDFIGDIDVHATYGLHPFTLHRSTDPDLPHVSIY